MDKQSNKQNTMQVSTSGHRLSWAPPVISVLSGNKAETGGSNTFFENSTGSGAPGQGGFTSS